MQTVYFVGLLQMYAQAKANVYGLTLGLALKPMMVPPAMVHNVIILVTGYAFYLFGLSIYG